MSSSPLPCLPCLPAAEEDVFVLMRFVIIGKRCFTKPCALSFLLGHIPDVAIARTGTNNNLELEARVANPSERKNAPSSVKKCPKWGFHYRVTGNECDF